MISGKTLSEIPTLRILLQVAQTDHAAIQEIQDCGAVIRTQAGDVLTCEAAGEVLERIALLDNVRSIELTRRLHPET